MNTSEILSGVPSEKRAQAETFLKHREAVSVPFLVRAMLFIGSLISASLLVGIADRLLAGIIPVLGRGVLFMAVGFLLGKTAANLPALRGAWRRQLGGLIGLAGQIILAFRLTDIPGVSVWMGVLAVAAISYPLFKNPFNRFLWCAAAASRASALRRTAPDTRRRMGWSSIRRKRVPCWPRPVFPAGRGSPGWS